MLCFALPSTRIDLQNWPLSLNRAYTKLSTNRSLGFPTPRPVTFIRFDLWLASSDSYIIRYDNASKSFIQYIGEIRASDWCICTSWYKIPLSDWLRGIWTCIITSRGWRNVRADALIIIIRPSTQTREEKKYVSFAVDWPCQSQYLYKLLFHRQLRARLCRWSQESRCSP